MRFAVEDAGPGVPAELHERVLEPFEQGPSTRDEPSPGAGIGLSLVARIAELHGAARGSPTGRAAWAPASRCCCPARDPRGPATGCGVLRLVRPEGLEPPTRGIEVRRSVHLSYGRRCC